MYPGYYSSWGYDQAGYPYSCQMYDYSQYAAAQVRWVAQSALPPARVRLHLSVCPSLSVCHQADILSHSLSSQEAEAVHDDGLEGWCWGGASGS